MISLSKVFLHAFESFVFLIKLLMSTFSFDILLSNSITEKYNDGKTKIIDVNIYNIILMLICNRKY